MTDEKLLLFAGKLFGSHLCAAFCRILRDSDAVADGFNFAEAGSAHLCPRASSLAVNFGEDRPPAIGKLSANKVELPERESLGHFFLALETIQERAIGIRRLGAVRASVLLDFAGQRAFLLQWWLGNVECKDRVAEFPEENHHEGRACCLPNEACKMDEPSRWCVLWQIAEEHSSKEVCPGPGCAAQKRVVDQGYADEAHDCNLEGPLCYASSILLNPFHGLHRLWLFLETLFLRLFDFQQLHRVSFTVEMQKRLCDGQVHVQSPEHNGVLVQPRPLVRPSFINPAQVRIVPS